MWQENTAPMLYAYINVGTGVDCTTIRELAQTIAKVVSYGAGWCSMPRSRTARRVNCSTSRARLHQRLVSRNSWRQGLPRNCHQWFLENQLNGSGRGLTMFTSGRFRHRRGAGHALISLDFIVENGRGNFTGPASQPSGAGLLVCAGGG